MSARVHTGVPSSSTVRTTLPLIWSPLDERSLRLLSDHLRSGIVIVGDGVAPSPSGRGYVLRRLIRRTLTTLRRDDPTRTLSDLPIELVEHTLEHFRQSVHPHEVRTVLLDKERTFDVLLERGRKVLSRSRFAGSLTDDDYHYLHDTHGLPRDLVVYLTTGAGVIWQISASALRRHMMELPHGRDHLPIRDDR